MERKEEMERNKENKRKELLEMKRERKKEIERKEFLEKQRERKKEMDRKEEMEREKGNWNQYLEIREEKKGKERKRKGRERD